MIYKLKKNDFYFLKFIIMPIYSFYKIVCKDENIKDCYVGKTNNLRNRWYSHKFNCNNKNSDRHNLKLYQFIRENGNIDNWNIIEIEKNEYDDKDSAIRERYWIEDLNSNLNNDIPSQTLKENHKKYYENNKEKIKEKQKEYREKNKEHIKEREKEYREKNKEKIKKEKKEYREKNKEKRKEYIKEYCEKNKEKIKKYQEIYYEKNKEKIKKYQEIYYENNK